MNNIKAKLGVIGEPIEHSLSPFIHKEFSKRTNVLLEYNTYNVSANNLDNFIKDFFESGGLGLNVTLPHKKDCLKAANQISSDVKILGAANTLFKDNNEIFAFSTDGPGFIQDCGDKSIPITGQNILILGSGGAAQSIIPSLAKLKPNNIIVDNRSKENLTSLIKEFSHLGVRNLTDYTESFDLVINATSAGFSGEFSWNDIHGLGPETIFYDLSYSRDETPFLIWAKKYSHKLFDGIGMLINQAALSFQIWFGVLPDTGNIEKVLRSK